MKLWTGDQFDTSGRDLSEEIRNGNAIAARCQRQQARLWAAGVAGDVPHDVYWAEPDGVSIALVVMAGSAAMYLPNIVLGHTIDTWSNPDE